MGTTLTGTTPQDTYDSLIKVTDNGPLSGTAKYLSDGLGNDSALALSTAFVGSGTTAISNWQLFKGFQTIGGNAFVGYEDQSEIWSNSFYDGAFKYFANGFATRFACINGDYDFSTAPENTSGAGAAATFTNRLKITNTGNVGIGTTAPAGKLEVSLPLYTGEDTSSEQAIFGNGVSSNGVRIGYNNNTNIGYINAIKPAVAWSTLVIGGTNVVFTANGNERVRVTTNGLTFNGDTAAANALDDYDEGNFTPTFSGTTRTGGTLAARYTKIGRLVSYDIFLFGATFSGSSGPASISGFPFASNSVTYGQGLITYNNCVDGNTNGGYVDAAGTTFFPVDENATTVASFIDGTADRNLMISGTYTV